eukprot:GHVR01161110.1.p1 GENE.GHVR01161110.1~~GHVR01161110.1.p1  ORF type:complete len:1355 (-),score=221.64 GHVR01161110.1:355-4419(-)
MDEAVVEVEEEEAEVMDEVVELEENVDFNVEVDIDAQLEDEVIIEVEDVDEEIDLNDALAVASLAKEAEDILKPLTVIEQMRINFRGKEDVAKLKIIVTKLDAIFEDRERSDFGRLPPDGSFNDEESSVASVIGADIVECCYSGRGFDLSEANTEVKTESVVTEVSVDGILPRLTQKRLNKLKAANQPKNNACSCVEERKQAIDCFLEHLDDEDGGLKKEKAAKRNGLKDTRRITNQIAKSRQKVADLIEEMETRELKYVEEIRSRSNYTQNLKDELAQTEVLDYWLHADEPEKIKIKVRNSNESRILVMKKIQAKRMELMEAGKDPNLVLGFDEVELGIDKDCLRGLPLDSIPDLTRIACGVSDLRGDKVIDKSFDPYSVFIADPVRRDAYIRMIQDRKFRPQQTATANLDLYLEHGFCWQDPVETYELPEVIVTLCPDVTVLGRVVTDWSDDRWLFPLKNFTASQKSNLFYRDVADDAVDMHGRPFVGMITSILHSLQVTNDQATGCLIWACALQHSDTLKPYINRLITSAMKGNKQLSDFLKQTGVKSSWHAMLIESTALLGCGLTKDIHLDALRRIVGSHEVDPAVRIAPEVLNKYLDIIYEEELDSAPVYDTSREYYGRRWGWSANGSNQNRLVRSLGVKIPEGLSEQIGRKCFLELVDYDEMFKDWKGDSFCTVTLKSNDKGKARTIYSMDTRHYVAYEYLMKPFEEKWNNKFIYLSPGVLKTAELQAWADERIGKGIFVCADFADMNSLHTNDSMRAAIDKMSQSCDDELKAVALAALDMTDVYIGKECLGKLRSTLPSGSRATSFFNSVLNRVYFYTVFGLEFGTWAALHTGDDVVFFATWEQLNGRDETYFKTKLEESPYGFNPAKQSIGSCSMEFLRTTYNGWYSGGYLCRSIAGAVSGNWVADSRNKPDELLNGFYSHISTMHIRSGGLQLGKLFKRTVQRRLKMSPELALALCENRAAPPGSPVFTTHKGRYQTIITETEEHAACSACVAAANIAGRRDVECTADRKYVYEGISRCLKLAAQFESKHGGKRAAKLLKKYDHNKIESQQNYNVIKCNCGKFFVTNSKTGDLVFRDFEEVGCSCKNPEGKPMPLLCGSRDDIKDYMGAKLPYPDKAKRKNTISRMMTVMLKRVNIYQYRKEIASAKIKVSGDYYKLPSGQEVSAYNVAEALKPCRCMQHAITHDTPDKAINDYMEKPDQKVELLQGWFGDDVKVVMQDASYASAIAKTAGSTTYSFKGLSRLQQRPAEFVGLDYKPKPEVLNRILRHPLVAMFAKRLKPRHILELISLEGSGEEKNADVIEAAANIHSDDNIHVTGLFPLASCQEMFFSYGGGAHLCIERPIHL